MFVKYIKVLYGLIFLLPIIISFYIGDFVIDNYLLAVMIFFLIIFSQRNKDVFFNVRSTKSQRLPLLIILSFLLLYFLFDYYTFNGLENRELVRENTKNFNFNLDSFFQQQLNFILLLLSANYISRGIINNKSLVFIIGFLIALILLFTNGTRWVFLLSISPLICFILIVANKLLKLLIFGLFGTSLLLLSSIRSNSGISLLSAFKYDIPSFQSKFVLNNYDPHVFDVIDFFYGNILILIPRFIWPSKPLDQSTTNYMLDVIGERFYYGSTILPGFLGSAFLYGNFFGVIVFSFFLRYLILKLLYRNKKLSESDNLVFFSLAFIGIILQSRGISIFYFVPLIYFKIYCRIKYFFIVQNSKT